MDPIILAITATLSVLGLAAGILSLVFQWKNIQQHIDVASFSRQLSELHAAHLDLWDKVDTWVKRDRVRTARAKKDEPAPQEPEQQTLTIHDQKQELRQRARTLGLVR